MKEIAIIAFDNFTDIDLFFMWDILGRNQQDWRVRILAITPTIHSAHGLEIPVHGSISDANQADAVLFSSGKKGVPEILANPNFLSALQLDSSRQYIGSICAGAFILDALGLLPERKATTHPDARNALQLRRVEPIDQPLVCHGKVATAGGCLSSLYLVGWLIESLFDQQKRKETLSHVLPTGQQALFENLIESSLIQSRI
ncbi:DJ-1/PfpI family protein [Providencia rettgeri]|uniref:DJ-1/PfpI family protein n=1 Tax=Providencia sp. TaxID=589 RepID=UPI0024AA6E8A|nr:DJ-1/PfpI family protein [Providencia rettgeri]ELR5233712.1 DJ-1/PfpI family protein [Providencia rettgeri]